MSFRELKSFIQFCFSDLARRLRLKQS